MRITIEDGSGKVLELTGDGGFFLRDGALLVPLDGGWTMREVLQLDGPVEGGEVSDLSIKTPNCDEWQAMMLLEKMDRQMEEDPELRLLCCAGCAACGEVFFALHSLDGEACPECGAALMELLLDEGEEEP